MLESPRVPAPESKPAHGPAASPAPGAPPSPDPARDAVFSTLARQAGAFPLFVISALDSAHLDARDAAFAHAVYDSVLRRWLTLRCIVGSRLKHPFDRLSSPAQAALLAGAAQLLLLDKVPPHAAIDTSVEWVKSHAARGVVGLVNAVLRNVARLVAGRQDTYEGSRFEIPLGNGGAVRLRDPVLPPGEVERLAVATSHPAALVRRWREHLGGQAAAHAAMHGIVGPPTIVNVAYAGPIQEATLGRHTSPGHRVFHGSRGELMDFLARRRDAFVQDAAASRAVESVGDLRPGLIVDVCAGQGTKTRQLALAFPGARIIATDADEVRLEELGRAAAGIARVVAYADVERETGGLADLVVLDVPCSNTGVLSRRVEAKYRAGPDQLARLTAIQREILLLGERLVRPGGAILYSTCSLEPEENGAQAAFMQGRGWRLSRESLTLPAGKPGDGPESYHDGAYSVLLTR